MAKRFLKTTILAGLLALMLPVVSAAQTLPATITVNAAATVTSFIPISIFGNNAAYWIGSTSNTAAQPKVQAAGNYFIRYPGGSSSDDYHWNGTGSFNANGYWAPSGTSWTSGFADNETYRGTTSSYGTPSHLTDGNTATTWMSNVDTNSPNHQYVILDLTGGGTTTVSAVTIAWGNPYATSFQVQYWTGATYQSPTNTNPESLWVNTSTGIVTGTGGTQGVAFTPVSTRYIRVLMTAASANVTANLGSVTITGPAYAIAEVTVYNGATQVSVNTATVTNGAAVQTAAQASSTDPASSLNYTTQSPGSTDFGAFMTYVNSFNPHAIPMITVNFGTGTPSEAASWVYYANVVEGYGIHYWQIGNETEGTWETGGPIPTQDYVKRYIEYYNAMKAVDPSIIITGPVAGGFNDGSNMYDGNGVVQDFVSMGGAAGVSLHGNAGYFINAIDYHWYPNYGTQTSPYPASQAMTSTYGLDPFPGQLNTWLSNAGVPSPSNVPVIMSEFNVDPSDLNFQVQLGNGLWVADALGHFIKAFGGRGYCNLWDTLNGGSGDTTAAGGDLGYLDVNNALAPRATYWAMKMMTNDWAIPGDTNSHQLIQTAVAVSGAPTSLLAAYSDYRPDGIFSIVVINKDPTNTYNTQVSGIPFSPNSTANMWTFNSTNYAWVTTGATPYHASPDTAPNSGTISNASATSFPVTFQPYSITVLQFTNSGHPTNTPTGTPTITATPTVTATPNYGPATLVDDFEDLSRDGTNPARTNLWGGTWATYLDTNGSTINIQYGVSPGAAGTNYAVKISGNIVAKTTTNNPYAGYISYLSPNWPPTAYNLSGAGVVGLEFWIYGDGNTYRIMVDNQAVTDGDNYGFNITPPAGKWTFYQEPFSAMVTQGWGTQTGLPSHFAGTDATGVQLGVEGYGISYNIEWDQIAFYTAAALATATPTQTPSSTATSTPTSSPTSSPSNTPTLTITATPTLTWTWTATPTGSWDTSTPTNTSTSTPSSTPTFTPSLTPSATPTSTPTFTPTSSVTSTRTTTATSTPTATITLTPTITSSFTWTPTPASINLLYPNPAYGNAPVNFNYNVASPVDQVKVKLFTVSFRKIYEDDTLSTAVGQNKYTLDFSKAGLNPANGLYYVVVSFSVGGHETHQIMKLLIQR